MSEPTPITPPARRGRLIAIIVGAVVVVAAIVVGVTFAVNAGSSKPTAASTNGAITTGKGSPSDPVKIGVVGASDPYWDVYKKAASDAGISISLVNFTEYPLPNPALTEGDLDLNQFQHIIYLATYNKSANADLVPIGSTAIYPLSLYSKKVTSVADIKAGDTIAIDNDASNLARSLLLLQAQGLVELKDGGSPFSTAADILPASKVKVKTLDAATVPTALPDVAGAIINNDFVKDAGLTASQALASDDPTNPSAQPYINIFAARAADKDNPTYLKLVQIFQDTKAVTDGLVETSGGTAVLTKTPVADLQKSLETVESEIK